MDANEMIEQEKWTRGKMEVTDDDLVVAGLEIASVIIDDIEGETPEALDAIDHANARRLAACWNALANLTTAEIEQLPPDSIRVDAYHATAARIAIEVNERLQRRIGELEEALSKLPKTTDGVTIVPGMTVYDSHDQIRVDAVCSRKIVQLESDEDLDFDDVEASWNLELCQCFSTRDAALAPAPTSDVGTVTT